MVSRILILDGYFQIVLKNVAATLVTAMLLVVCGTVILRPFGHVFFGSDELTRLLLSWTVAVGAALGAREGGHLAVEIVVDRVPSRMRKVMLTLSSIMIIAFLLVLLFTGMRYALIGFGGSSTTPGLGISPGWGQLAWPVAALLMLWAATWQLALHIVLMLKGSESGI